MQFLPGACVLLARLLGFNTRPFKVSSYETPISAPQGKAMSAGLIAVFLVPRRLPRPNRAHSRHPLNEYVDQRSKRAVLWGTQAQGPGPAVPEGSGPDSRISAPRAWFPRTSVIKHGPWEALGKRQGRRRLPWFFLAAWVVTDMSQLPASSPRLPWLS